jgi:cytochrome c oxidase cbb3-type subunit III
MGDLPMAELEKESQVVEAKKTAFLEKAAAKINENSVTLLADAKALEEGKAIFAANCAACHAADGGGSVGPNLTDEYWLHGGGIKNVFKTVKYGVPEKGMISWEKQLNPLKMQQVSSYIISLKGKKPAVAKEPQGEIYKEEAATADSTVAAK